MIEFEGVAKGGEKTSVEAGSHYSCDRFFSTKMTVGKIYRVKVEEVRAELPAGFDWFGNVAIAPGCEVRAIDGSLIFTAPFRVRHFTLDASDLVELVEAFRAEGLLK